MKFEEIQASWDKDFQAKQTKLIHKKINRLGFVTRLTLALMLAAIPTIVVQVWSSLSWWTIASFIVAVPVCFITVNEFFYLRDN